LIEAVRAVPVEARRRVITRWRARYGAMTPRSRDGP